MAKKIDAWWSDIGLIAYALVQCDVLGGAEFKGIIKAEAERLARDRAETRAMRADWLDAMREEVLPRGGETWI